MNERPISQSWWQEIKDFPWLSVGWLTIGTGILAACFLLWISSQLTDRLTVEVVQPIATADAAEVSVGLPDRLEGEIGMLFDAVAVLDLNKQVAVVGQRAPEFRGTEFIKANASHWTLQVMKVSQESVVKTYLLQRNDKQRFQYFRVVEGVQEHYLLTYGNFTTVQTAMGALRTMQFDLPDSVKAFPERFSTYQAAVKDQGSEERMSGMAQKIRQIVLKPVAIPINVDPVEVVISRQNKSLSEPAFGALKSDQVAAKTDPAISLPVTPPDKAGRSSSGASSPSPTAIPSPPVAPASPASEPPSAIQDPFN